MDENNLQQELTRLHANLCSAISDPKRIMLLYTIHERPRNVSNLARAVDISQSSASRHLKTLKQRGLITAKRQGASVVYRLTDERLIQALDLLRDVLTDTLRNQAALIQEDADSWLP